MTEDAELDLDAIERSSDHMVASNKLIVRALIVHLRSNIEDNRALREQVAEMVRQRNMALTKVGEAWRRVGAAEEQVATLTAGIRELADAVDAWTPYDSRDTGQTFLAESVRDLVDDFRALLASHGEEDDA